MTSIIKNYLKVIFFLSFFISTPALGATLPYSQSMTSCSDRVLPGTQNPSDCQDIERYSDGRCTLGGANLGASITSQANNPSGGGGKGIRCYNGGNNNPDGGQFAINLDTNESEVWVRFYARFQNTWQYEGNSVEDFKILWVNDVNTMGAGAIFGFKDDIYNAYNVRFWNQNSATELVYGTANHGFQWLNGGNTGDDKWHLYEIHLKHETTNSPYNGVEEVKLDGILVLSNYAVDFASNYFTHFRFNINTKYLSPSTCQYWDIDDIAISKTGWIGPVGGSIVTPPDTTSQPAAPRGLAVI